MPISEEFYPAGGTCPSCGEPYYVRVQKTGVFGGDVVEIGREGPACFNDECEQFRQPVAER